MGGGSSLATAPRDTVNVKITNKNTEQIKSCIKAPKATIKSMKKVHLDTDDPDYQNQMEEVDLRARPQSMDKMSTTSIRTTPHKQTKKKVLSIQVLQS